MQTLHNRSHLINMLLPLLLCVVFPGVWSVEPGPTYNYRDFRTGQSLNCTMCPPGTHMAAHCTATTPTVCSPCDEAHYTARWNYLPGCLYCNNLCFGNLEVETECSPVSNRVCRCRQGFYMTHNRCVRHRKCKPGTGVQKKGTPQANTVCKMCSEGYFSNSSRAIDSCVKHQQCTSGQLMFLPGSVYHDTVCGSCEDFNKSGDTFRAFVSGLFTSHFTSHKIHLTKVKRIVNRHVNKSARRRRIKRAVRGPLQDHLSWMTRDPEQLKQFIRMLRASELNQLAEVLEMRLNALQEQLLNCS